MAARLLNRQKQIDPASLTPIPRIRKTGGTTGRYKGSGRGIPPNTKFPMWERVETFFSQVKKIPNGCWIWRGKSNNGGYGVFALNGKAILAHRFSWLVKYGKLPDKPHLCHECCVRLCVNPDHLFPGTAQENNDHLAKTGRAWWIQLRQLKEKLNGCPTAQ